MNQIAQYEDDRAVSPFHNSQIATREGSNALGDASQQRAVAEVQSAITVAKRFPRNQQQAMDNILNACTRPTLANGALYSYARGGQEITGPSIRLAEAMAQAWGNIDFGIRELEQKDGSSTVEAYCWDMETNTRQVKVFQVAHARHTKAGTKKLTDPRDIYEMVANQGARRLRACILGVIPGDVTETAVKQCEQTMKASADTSPEAQQKLVEAFKAFGVSKEQIEKRIQCRLDAIRPAQVVQLKKIYASLRDGMSKPDEWFEGDLSESVEVAEKMAGKTKSKAVEKTETDYVREALQNASSRDELDEACNRVGMCPEGDRAALMAIYAEREPTIGD